MTPYGLSWAWNWRLAVVWGPPCFPALTFPPNIPKPHSHYLTFHSHEFSTVFLTPMTLPLYAQMGSFCSKCSSSWYLRQPPTHTAKPRLCYLFHEACPDLPHGESLFPSWVPSGPKLSSTTILNTVYGKYCLHSECLLAYFSHSLENSLMAGTVTY